MFNKVLTFGIEEGGPQMSHPKTGHSPYTQAAGARKRNGLQLIFCHLLRIKVKDNHCAPKIFFHSIIKSLGEVLQKMGHKSFICVN